MLKIIAAAVLVLALFTGTSLAESGRLEASDPRLESGEHFDLHTYDGRSGSVLSITLTSDEFDPYLAVLGPDEADLLQVDDSEGFGLDVRETLPLPQDGTYTIVVTSALPGETGAYTLDLSSEPPAPPANPLAPAAPNPLAPTPTSPSAAFAGTFVGDDVRISLEDRNGSVGGTLTAGGVPYEVQARAEGNSLQGTFGSGGTEFPFTASLDGDLLTLESGGGRYVLSRAPAGAPRAPDATPAAPGATPAAPGAGTAPPAAPDPAVVTPEPAIGPRPGFVTGTVFDTFGRPLPGAGILISGTTYTQGQRTQFEATTGADGTYAVRVPDGRYRAKAWIDVPYDGALFSRLLHPMSGSPSTEVDSVDGGTLDFQWRLSGLVSPPGDDPSDYHGASIDFSYCGLPADAYCSSDYAAFPDRPIAPGGSSVQVTLVPVAPLLDGSEGRSIVFDFDVREQDPDYPYGGAPNAPAGYENGGGGRTTLGTDWEYHSTYLHDIPVGVYELSARVVRPDGASWPLRLGLSADDVEHETVRVSWSPWDGFQGRSYTGGGIQELDVYVRD